MKKSILRPVLTAGALASLTLALLRAQTQTSQPTFATPEEAIQAIGDAAEHNDTAAMLKLFGPGGKSLWLPPTMPARAKTAPTSPACCTRRHKWSATRPMPIA